MRESFGSQLAQIGEYARMGLDPAAELKSLLPLIRHIQFADAQGRHEPGTGNLGFEAPLAVLDAGGV
jgi:hydroxypyruvate isomerase